MCQREGYIYQHFPKMKESAVPVELNTVTDSFAIKVALKFVTLFTLYKYSSSFIAVLVVL